MWVLSRTVDQTVQAIDESKKETVTSYRLFREILPINIWFKYLLDKITTK